MSQFRLPFRQIHLDFHTSGEIPEVGKDFDPEEFAYTLKKAHVNSITCFAKCHHGYLYYDSRKFPERVHPNLVNKDLLKQQIEVCHKYGIRVPIYISVQWDHFSAKEHPEWLTRNEDGSAIIMSTNSGDQIQKTFEAGFYHSLCVNSPYRELLKHQIGEVLELFDPVDGLFFDIVFPIACACEWCIEDMKRKGFKPHIREDRMGYGQQMITQFKQEITSFIREFSQDCSIFFNRGHVGVFEKNSKDSYTHFEIESLPSGGWGYLHFPISVRYARNIKDEVLGQTGKFHTSWGDFHSFKNKEALEFECFRMLAYGAKCLIGDQMHPNGRLSKEVYELIGSVYKEVEEKEEWCENAKPIAEIGVMTPEEFLSQNSSASLTEDIQGVTRMLEEGGYQFDIIDSSFDFSKYKLIILPDNIPVDEALSKKISNYLHKGGSIIATFESGLSKEKNEMMIKELGVKLRENSTTDLYGNLVRGKVFSRADYTDYILPRDVLLKNLNSTEYVMYIKGTEIIALEGTEILADIVLPYFYRTYEHFCSHRQAPSSGIIDGPAITKRGNTIYFTHPIFTIYYHYAPQWCKQLMFNAIDLLLKSKLVIHNGPTTLLTTLNEQKQKGRYVLHLLHYVPVRKAKEIDIIEDMIPLYNLYISLLLKEEVKKIELVPQREKILFEKKGDRIEFIIPVVKGHQMISIEYI